TRFSRDWSSDVCSSDLQAVEMLRRLHAISGDRTHLFPGRDDRNRPMSVHSIRQALKVLGWSGTYSPHGTRTTGSTRLNEMGYRRSEERRVGKECRSRGW